MEKRADVWTVQEAEAESSLTTNVVFEEDYDTLYDAYDQLNDKYEEMEEMINELYRKV